MSKNLRIDIDNFGYEVFIKRGISELLILTLKKYTKNKKILFVTDDFFINSKIKYFVALLKADGFDCQIYLMKGGKNSKSIAELIEIYRILESNNFSRDSTLIALGGGVIGDLGGFAASTWYRGMNLIHMPTTLMAMIDSSIGGKVAINFRETINAVGNYYHPIANFMDLDFVYTLSDKDYFSGIAEAIKCGLIADINFFQWIEQKSFLIKSREQSALTYIISKSIEIKVNHVNGDLKENGKRLLLNFGHTIGHAIEMATHSEFGEIYRHGEGVALGMISAMYISLRLNKIAQIDINHVIKIIQLFELPVKIPAESIGFKRDILVNRIYELCFRDKKRKDNNLRFVLLDKIGSASIYSEVPSNIIKEAIEFIMDN